MFVEFLWVLCLPRFAYEFGYLLVAEGSVPPLLWEASGLFGPSGFHSFPIVNIISLEKKSVIWVIWISQNLEEGVGTLDDRAPGSHVGILRDTVIYKNTPTR